MRKIQFSSLALITLLLSCQLISKDLPNFSDFSKLPIEEAIVKKMRGIIAVNSKFKKISPSGLMTDTPSPKTRPKILPAIIPHNNQMMLL